MAAMCNGLGLNNMTNNAAARSAGRSPSHRVAEITAVVAALCVIGGVTWLLWLVAPPVYASVSEVLSHEARALQWSSTAQGVLIAFLLMSVASAGGLWSSDKLLKSPKNYSPVATAILRALGAMGCFLPIPAAVLLFVLAVVISTSPLLMVAVVVLLMGALSTYFHFMP